ncbi:MAG: DUF2726 domain-containing protein [Thermoguttaceae bacterium]|nr:DUF2726 domain-containing protein [Thermoguttaceae bacterium]
MPSLVYLLTLATIAVIVIGIGYPIVKYLEYLIGQQRQVAGDDGEESYSGTEDGTEDISKDYDPRASIMTPTEIKYYEDLCDALNRAGLEVSVWPQVNVSAIIEASGNDSKQKARAFNRICRKSVDYVIANKETQATLVCIELDDYTHSWNSRQERDDFINTVFDEVGIPLFRIKVERHYDFYEIVSTVKRMLK